ncbi:Ubiquitin-conjugating enzyme ATG10 [Phytophthora nicotianae]|uniref:Ubiquitin-like-conjugating enzyme ATG10 n=1 Tax=Phytophthora nicotianae TaxID=4792 RepID=A0A0W8C0M0_PHYNI|nr:Ubiquitin-conjugating enzyme ATG10 [Phytophthora nicotianae]
MRDGSLSYERFCAEAELLQKRSHELARNSRQFCPDSGSVKTTMELDGDIDELLVHDEDNWTDVDEPQTMILQSGEAETALLEFHIVFHTIYQTPVLYFRALAVDGTPLNTNTVTCGVQFPGSNGRPAFVGMEEHPVVGKPFSFLHPCETAAAMQLLQAQLQSSKSTEVSSDVKIPQYLASWLSLVQPLTGISPLDYYSV